MALIPTLPCLPLTVLSLSPPYNSLFHIHVYLLFFKTQWAQQYAYTDNGDSPISQNLSMVTSSEGMGQAFWPTLSLNPW